MEENIQEFTITKENRIIIGFTENTTELVIQKTFVGNGSNGTAKGQTYQITKIGKRAFANTKIQSVQMANSIKVIENEAFAGCIHLQEVVLSENLSVIGQHAFFCCKSINSIRFPKALELTPPTP